MSPKVLRRCSICGKFHAAYLVEEQGVKRYYCYNCWVGRQSALAASTAAKKAEAPQKDQPGEQASRPDGDQKSG